MRRADAVQEIRAIARVCRGPRRDGSEALLATLLLESKREEAAALDESLRLGCGRDFNDTIVAGPLDGQVHAYQCPGCAVIGVYRAPLYDVED